MTREAPRPSELLERDEVRMLSRALLEWNGPARRSEQLAVGMEFTGSQDLLSQCGSLRSALDEDAPLTPVNRARALLATEIVFVSDLVGSGVDWPTATGRGDEETITLLRSVQRKLARTIRPYYGTRPAE
ncbi:hypothetical protein [Streptomyces flavofungini]|uniref:hypothetical protein n=1 Tax=Streptomyces flavofungini TaxID=68200 RepID=UPI0034DF8E90